MVTVVKHRVPPLMVMQYRPSVVDGNEGMIWEAIVGLKVGSVIQPALRVNERGNGGCLDIDQVSAGADSRALRQKAEKALLHYAERDIIRAEEDSPVGGWTDRLLHEMVAQYIADEEFQFGPPRFVKDAIPLQEKKCWCGKVIDRKKNAYAGTCSDACDEEQQFDLHFQHMQSLVPGLAIEEYCHLPWDNHIPGVSKAIRALELAQRKGSWPQDGRKATVERARAALCTAAGYIEEARALLRVLRLEHEQECTPKGICEKCTKLWSTDKYQVFKKWQPCKGCRAECARALGLKEVPKP